MVLLLPLLLLRMLVILAALLFMATCSYIGGLGWCAYCSCCCELISEATDSRL